MGVEAHFDLFFAVFFNGQQRQIIFAEISGFRCFDVFCKGTAGNGTKHEYLAYAVGAIDNIVLSPVLNCNQFFSNGVKPGFFLYFLDGVFCNRNIHIAPAAGQGPCAVVFVNQQYPAVFEYCRAGINTAYPASRTGHISYEQVFRT